MRTEIIKLDRDNPDPDKLIKAAEVLRAGGLVAFPTETVYGLGANALDEKAVRSIFEAKGRPSDNPLIVHIAEKVQVAGLVKEIPEAADILMDKFWPGPLTLVLKKSSCVPDIITAGLDTVAVRMPSHPVALELIRLAGVPVAAPSANLSGKPSPTIAGHVIEDLSGRVDIILDAGDAKVGLESTVLDLTVHPPVILRPGGVSRGQLAGELGEIGVDPGILSSKGPVPAPKSPGMKYTHYAPKAEVIIVQGTLKAMQNKIEEMAADFADKGVEAGIMATDQTKNQYPAGYSLISLGDRKNPETIAANLFGSLRRFDELGVKVILAEAVEEEGIGAAVMNRMRKAAGNRIVEV